MRHWASSSHSSVAKKLSHVALSYASPNEPIDGLTPACLQRRPNAIDVYCPNSIVSCNAPAERGSDDGIEATALGSI